MMAILASSALASHFVSIPVLDMWVYIQLTLCCMRVSQKLACACCRFGKTGPCPRRAITLCITGEIETGITLVGMVLVSLRRMYRLPVRVQLLTTQEHRWRTRTWFGNIWCLVLHCGTRAISHGLPLPDPLILWVALSSGCNIAARKPPRVSIFAQWESHGWISRLIGAPSPWGVIEILDWDEHRPP